MPSWTPENDLKLVREIFSHNDIKVSSKLCETIAKSFGDDCTPKAIRMRIDHLRKGGKKPETSPTKAATPSKVTKTPTKPKGTKTNTNLGKQIESSEVFEEMLGFDVSPSKQSFKIEKVEDEDEI